MDEKTKKKAKNRTKEQKDIRKYTPRPVDDWLDKETQKDEKQQALIQEEYPGIPEFMSVVELARRLGVNTHTVYRACRVGARDNSAGIQAFKQGKKWVIPRAEAYRVLKYGYNIDHKAAP